MTGWSAGIVPYCGAPPLPQELAGRWNLDPVLIGALVALLAVYLAGAHRAGAAIPRWRRRAFLAGWALGSLALVSPLCPLSVALFAARVGQHMILTLLAAPLIALGKPLAACAGALGQALRPRGGHPLAAATAFMALLWVWHAPVPYTATFLSDAVYWAMHVTMIGSAVWLWAEILNDGPSLAGAAAAALSMVQMGFLGAVITLSERALYAPHGLTTAPWGLTQVEDQQLGGAIMWVPGTAVFLAIGSWMAWRALQQRLSPAAVRPIPQALG